VNNRLLEYETPSEDEIVSRLLSSLHKTLDEQFPQTSKVGEAARRFSRTEFSATSEDTIIEQNPGPAMGEPIGPEGHPSVSVPPPPVPSEGRRTPPSTPSAEQAGKPAAPRQSGQKKTAAPSSLVLPSGHSDFQQPLSQTQAASQNTNSFGSDVRRTNSKSFSLKLFAFMFAILLGVAIGSVVFLFWSY
jgi:hypothetical protein